jgi:transcriptional regulator with XRE-family HTH domain
MSFADNLKSIRQERHISQEELAEIIGVSRQAVSKWEQGSGYPEMDEIAEAINNGVPAYELKYAVKVKNKMLRVKIDEE